MENIRKWKYILIAIMVLGSMMISLVGCGGDGGDETTTEETTGTTAEESTESESSPASNVAGGNTLTVTVNPVGGGTVSPNTGSYAPGTTIKLTATPATGYSFTRWAGDAIGSSRNLSITMDSDKEVTAYFTPTGDRTLQKIEILPPSVNIDVNGRQQLTATAKYTDGSSSTVTGAVQWRSSNPTIATISSSGTVVGLSSGSVTITAILDTIQGRAVVVVK